MIRNSFDSYDSYVKLLYVNYKPERCLLLSKTFPSSQKRFKILP